MSLIIGLFHLVVNAVIWIFSNQWIIGSIFIFCGGCALYEKKGSGVICILLGLAIIANGGF